MGTVVRPTEDSYALVAFKRQGDSFQASTSIRDLALIREDPALILRSAAEIYTKALGEILRWQGDAGVLQRAKTPMSARKAWELGDIVHRLNELLAENGCQLEDLYDHLESHAGVRRKWLSKYVTFRRYVNDRNVIPPDLKWNSVEKVTKSAGQAIAAGLPVGA